MSDTSKQIAARFEGPNGQRLLQTVLRDQSILENNDDVVKAAASKVSIMTYEKGQAIITQGDTDSDMFLILAGSVVVVKDGREVEHRSAGTVVGELVAIDPSSIRSVTVKACEPTVAARLAEVDLTSIADTFPFVWRHLAKELACRLRARNAGPFRPTKPRVFIASSTEAIERAKDLRDRLQSEIVDVDIWNTGVFEAGMTYIESLESELLKADFAVLFLSPDDYVLSRGEVTSSPRDNVIFELGLFVGTLTRKRAIMVQPDGVDLKIPTDLLGVNTIKYRAADVQPVVTQLYDIFKTLGTR
jgi:CRP/FNR family transcriptional regulator, cyclic AMP receptor protein